MYKKILNCSQKKAFFQNQYAFLKNNNNFERIFAYNLWFWQIYDQINLIPLDGIMVFPTSKLPGEKK